MGLLPELPGEPGVYGPGHLFEVLPEVLVYSPIWTHWTPR